MININEQTSQLNITGEVKRWDRYKEIKISNEYEKNPKITLIGGTFETSPLYPNGRYIKAETIQEELTNENYTDTFDLINPMTGEKIGIVSYQDYQVMTFSLCLHLKEKQKNAPKTQPTRRID